MNVDTMRRIDRLAGVPLCAGATFLLRLRDLVRPHEERRVRRILFCELSEMGTTILAEPAMRKAREQFSAELFFVIFARNVGSLQLLGTFPPDNIFTISDRSIFAPRPRCARLPALDPAQGDRHRRRSRIVFARAPEERERAEQLPATNAPRSVSSAGLEPRRTAGAVRASRADGQQRFRAGAFCRRRRAAHYRAVRPGDSQTLPAARQFARHLCRAACSPCVTAHNHRKTACTDNVCMQVIGVDEVYTAVAEMLAAPVRSPAAVT
jgi:hypothetical protein